MSTFRIYNSPFLSKLCHCSLSMQAHCLFHIILNIYQNQIRSYLLNTMKWYYNYSIIRQLSPYSTTGWYHNFRNTSLAFIEFQITHMPKPFTFPHADDFFFAKLTISNHIITSIILFLYYMILFHEIYNKKDTILTAVSFLACV